MIDDFSGRYRFLSNFHLSPVLFEGLVYPSVECAYQAAKTRNKDLRIDFTVMTSAKAKRVGRKLPLRRDWDKVRVAIMEQILREKFSTKRMARQLLATGDEQLVEDNWWGDTFWGVCRGQGENMLGKLLMKIRADLRDAG